MLHWLLLTSFVSPILMAGASKIPALETVRRADIVEQVTVSGLVLPNRRTVFTPPYNAYIKKIFVKIGDEVKANDPVISFVQSLRGSAEETYPMRAPFAGTVVQVLKSEGEFVETAKDTSNLIRIDDLTRLFVQSDIPESDIKRVKVGQEVTIKANAVLNHIYHGIIRDISLAAKENKEWSRAGDRVEFSVKMEVTDKDKRLMPGMSTIVDVITEKRTNALVLPQEFVEKQDGNYFVTLESGERRKINVGIQNSDSFEIKDGIKEKDRIKIVDFFSLHENNH